MVLTSLNRRFRRIATAALLTFLIISFFVLDFKNEEAYLNTKFDEPILNVDKFNDQLNQESIKGLRTVGSIDSTSNINAEQQDTMHKLPQLDDKSKLKAQKEHDDRLQMIQGIYRDNEVAQFDRAVSKYPAIESELAVSRNGKGLANAPYKISGLTENYPLSPEDLSRLPESDSSTQQLPTIQFDFKKKTANNKYLSEIKTVLAKNWALYMKYAKGYDEIEPVTKKPINSFTGWGFTLIDSLDTLYIMKMEKEFKEAVALVAKIDFNCILTDTIPIFETTIRVLGGLISAYELSGEKILLQKSVEIGDLLMFSFDTPNRMPLLYLNWKTHNQTKRFASSKAALSEVGSLSLEFTKLSQLTNNPKYYDAIQRIFDQLNRIQMAAKIPGLVPIDLDISGCQLYSTHNTLSQNEVSGNMMNASFNGMDVLCVKQEVEVNHYTNSESYSLGGLSDSFYEYLIKQYILVPSQTITGSGENILSLYKKASTAIKKYLIFKPRMPHNEEILFTGDIVVNYPADGKITDNSIQFKNQVNHLDCFQGGMFAIGAKILGSSEDLEIAGNLTKGCLALSDQFGIMPEYINVDRCDDWDDCAYDEDYKINYIRKHTETGVSLPELKNPYKKLKYQTIDQTIPYAPLQVDSDGEIVWKVGNSANQPLWVNKMDSRYLLRPELIESVFVMYRVTGDLFYREKGWQYFKNLIKYCEVEGSDGILSSIKDVTNSDKRHPDYYLNTQESFLFAETLKYLYLLFTEEDVISLDEYVLNTEAHPFKRF